MNEQMRRIREQCDREDALESWCTLAALIAAASLILNVVLVVLVYMLLR